MGTPTDEVIRQLAAFGSKLDEFVQSREGNRLEGGQVDEGFCKGVCIDWTRRVLQGGRPAFTEKEERKGPQAVRQATLQMGIERRNSAYNAVTLVRNELVAAKNQHLDRTPVPITAELEANLQQYLEFNPNPNRTYAYATVGQWLTLLQEIAESYDHTAETGFAQFVHSMDQNNLAIRRQQAREESRRPFSHLRIVASKDRSYYAPISAGVDELMQLNEFGAGTVLIFSFGLRSRNRETGHAVAAHRIGASRYRFLDPNYGVFEYSFNSTRSALNYLFGTHYGEPIYGEDGDRVTGYLGYTIVGLAQ